MYWKVKWVSYFRTIYFYKRLSYYRTEEYLEKSKFNAWMLWLLFLIFPVFLPYWQSIEEVFFHGDKTKSIMLGHTYKKILLKILNHLFLWIFSSLLKNTSSCVCDQTLFLWSYDHVKIGWCNGYMGEYLPKIPLPSREHTLCSPSAKNPKKK